MGLLQWPTDLVDNEGCGEHWAVDGSENEHGETLNPFCVRPVEGKDGVFELEDYRGKDIGGDPEVRGQPFYSIQEAKSYAEKLHTEETLRTYDGKSFADFIATKKRVSNLEQLFPNSFDPADVRDVRGYVYGQDVRNAPDKAYWIEVSVQGGHLYYDADAGGRGRKLEDVERSLFRFLVSEEATF